MVVRSLAVKLGQDQAQQLPGVSVVIRQGKPEVRLINQPTG